jgi:hypothetical protein
MSAFALAFVGGKVGMNTLGNLTVEFLQVLRWQEWFPLACLLFSFHGLGRILSLGAGLRRSLLCFPVFRLVASPSLRDLSFNFIQLSQSGAHDAQVGSLEAVQFGLKGRQIQLTLG